MKPKNTIIYNAEVEEEIIGLIVLHSEIVLTILDGKVVSSDFFQPITRHAFECAMNLYHRGKKIDDFILSQEMKKMDPEAYENVHQNLVTMGGKVISVHSLTGCIELLKEASFRRKLSEISQKLTLNLEDPSCEIYKIKEQIKDLLETSYNDFEKGNIQIQSCMDIIASEMEEKIKNPNRDTKIKTGFSNIDQLIRGVSPGEVLLIGSNTGDGKTSLGCNFATNMARAGKKVGYFSGEMDLEKLTKRIIASEASIPLDSLDAPKQEDVETVRALRKAIQSWNLVVKFDDRPTTQSTISEMTRMAKQDKVDVIIIDYVQKIQDNGYGNRTEKVARVSHEIDGAAMRLGVAVIALVQLNRQPDGSVKPSIDHIQHSSQMGQDSDFALLIKRIGAKPGIKDVYENEIWIRKNRNGERDVSVKMDFVGPYFRFEEALPEWAVRP